MADDDRFYVRTLTLENFRCFEKAELGPFDPHFNLIIGENGAGKSSVLVALAGLFRELAAPGASTAPKHLIGQNDIRLIHRVGEQGVQYREPSGSLKLTAEFEETVGGEFVVLSTTLTHRPGSRAPRKNRQGFDGQNLTATIDHTQEALVDNLALPLLAFYTTARGFSANHNGRSESSIGQRLRTSAFHNWRNAGTSGIELGEWLRDQTLEALQFSVRKISSGDAAIDMEPLLQINLVTEAVRKAMDGASSVYFDASRRDIVVQFKDGEAKLFSGMSDGQRALIGLVADMARRACILNGPVFGGRALTETPGLILIDEIDLHLHPKWQRQIVDAIKRIFPKIQFFATTHSPQVIGEAQPEEIVMLTKDGKQKRPAGSFGMDSNWILECVMEAEGRDPAIAREIKNLWTSIEDGEFEAARAQIERLRSEIGPLAPDLAGAESYMWRMEQEARGADEAAE